MKIIKNKMNLVNVAIENLGAKIKTYSSFIDNLHPPSNILQSNEDSLWATTQGLPQFVIVSLQDLNVNFRNINEVGFMLWHDYDTNPKIIELWVAQTTDQQFSFWAQFSLDQKKGIQLFEIQPLPQNYIYLKISITQTYGAFETYLNQVFLMAQDVVSMKRITTQKDIAVKKKKQLDLEDLQSDLNNLINIDKRISRSKSKSKSNKKKPQKFLNKNIRQSSELSSSKAKYQIQNRKGKNSISKGSSSIKKPGFSIYYRQSQALPDDESHQYVSNDYQSSSSNAFSKQIQIKKNQKIKQLSQESQQLMNSLYSQSIGRSPSLNVNSVSNSYSVSGHLGLVHEHNSQKYLTEKQKINKILQQQKRRLFEQKFKDQQIVKEQSDKEVQLSQDQIEEQDSDQQNFGNQIINNTPKYKEISQQNQQQLYQDQHSSEQQLNSSQDKKNYNVAILALSKHVVKLQDNMEAIQRKVDVLDMKVVHSHKKIQQEILQKVQNKVEEIVDKRLKKIWSVKNVFKTLQNDQKSNLKQQQQHNRKFEKQNQKFDYKKNLMKEFFKSEYFQQQQNAIIQRDKTKTKRRMKQNFPEDSKAFDEKRQPKNYNLEQEDKINRLKTSKSFADITKKGKHNCPETQITRKQSFKKHKQGPNQQYIANLLEKLNAKLKQRQLKLSKMQKREKQKNKEQKKIDQYTHKHERIRKNQYKRTVPSNQEDYS